MPSFEELAAEDIVRIINDEVANQTRKDRGKLLTPILVAGARAEIGARVAHRVYVESHFDMRDARIIGFLAAKLMVPT